MFKRSTQLLLFLAYQVGYVVGFINPHYKEEADG